jgi:hypothetical protein
MAAIKAVLRVGLARGGTRILKLAIDLNPKLRDSAPAVLFFLPALGRF